MFTAKHLCWSFVLIKLKAWRPGTLLKKESNTGVSRWMLRNFKDITCKRVLLEVKLNLSKVCKLARVSESAKFSNTAQTSLLLLFLLRVWFCLRVWQKQVICDKVSRSFSFVSLKYNFFSFRGALRKELLFEISRTGANNRPSVLITIKKLLDIYISSWVIFILRVHIYKTIVIIY